jgi:hypothetical protein
MQALWHVKGYTNSVTEGTGASEASTDLKHANRQLHLKCVMLLLDLPLHTGCVA